MATLAADSPREYEYSADPMFEDLPVIASDILYEGAAAGSVLASGHVRPLVALDAFAGFVNQQIDNSTGAAAARTARLRRIGVAKLTVTGVASAADIGKPVYATDDDTFTLSPSGGTLIGWVQRWVTSTTCHVFFVAEQLRQGGKAASRIPVVVKTADYTITAADFGKVFVTTGATGTVIFTLPASAAANIGARVEFYNVADQTMTVAGTAGELVFKNDLAANSVSYATATELIGGGFVATQISATKWLVAPLAEEAQTITVAT